MEENDFEYHYSGYLCSTVLSKRDIPVDKTIGPYPVTAATQNLSSISGLYMYVNTPPMGIGTQAPMVFESILRAKSYNLNDEEHKVIEVGKYKIQNPVWSSGAFPFDKIHGNFHLGEALVMTKKFLEKNFTPIVDCVERVMERAATRPSDILTKGRQTWCPIAEKSVPAAKAYKNMADFYHENLGRHPGTMLDWINMFLECCEKESLTVPLHTWYYDTKILVDPVLKAKRTQVKRRRKTQKTEIKGKDKCLEKMLDYARSFCSYVKHKERGKLNRRAIASPSMILRMFLYIIEEVHLALGKRIDGSTISIGGEEKKCRLTNVLHGFSLLPSEGHYLQATEDATKWNECLSPALFCVLSETWFSESVREKLGLPLPSSMQKLFKRICETSHFILAIKRITLGESPTAESPDSYNKLQWNKEDLPRFSQRYRDWMEPNMDMIEEEKYIYASCGMLMGMHNALSTTVGLLCQTWPIQSDTKKLVTLRSSDDSMTLFGGGTFMELVNVVSEHYMSMKLMGINPSEEKTRIFPRHYGEYTSWYEDGVLVSQYGVESTKLRPQGKSPHDDFNSISKGVQNSLNRLEVNPVGAEAMIKIGCNNVRSLWRVKRNPEKRPGIKRNVILLSDGGMIPWTSMKVGLDEIAIRFSNAESDEDKDYLYRIMDPECPLIPDPGEEVLWNKDTGTLTLGLPETPRNAFTYVKRSNGTANSEMTKADMATEKANQQVISACTTVDPSLHIEHPASKTTLAQHLLCVIETMENKYELTEEEEQEIRKAQEMLLFGIGNNDGYISD